MKNDAYIRIPAIYKKLKNAEETRRAFYLSAPLGCGKTAALQYYFRNKSVLWLSGEEGCLVSCPKPESIRQSIVVIDDITWLTNETSRDYVIQLIDARKQLVVMSGRAKLPEWLKPACINHHFMIADRKDLELDENQTQKLLLSYGVELPKEQIQEINQNTCGYALFTLMIAYQMQNKNEYSEIVRDAARIDVFQYLNKAFYEKCDSNLRELLMAVSCFPTFTLELAEFVTGNRRAANLLNQAMAVGDFLTKHEDGTYEMIIILKRYFIWKQQIENQQKLQMLVWERAALYYEMKEQIGEALIYYEKTENHKAISKLLIRNAEMHPGTGHYFETRQYYLKLPEEELEQSPVLMAGISMLYSLLMQPEKSEYWYDKLKEYEQSIANDEMITDGNVMKKEAKRRILYLDIALPHRGSLSMIEILKQGATFITDRKLKMPEFSVTSNLPSIMNGGKDFCEWSRKDRELARVMKKPVELMLGKWGAGLVNISLAESLFEKGETDIYEVISLLNSGYTKADLGGKIEMCFVATAVLCHIHVSHKQLSLAKMQMKEFEKKAVLEDALRLIPNIHATYAWFALLEGEQKKAEKWLVNEAPNELQEFYVLNRYQYVMKVRVYLALERYSYAMNLIERLSVYFKEYQRTYMNMENEVLKAILQYRIQVGNWKETLRNVLKEIEGYHFLYLISKEGAAIWPLLTELMSESEKGFVSDEFAAEMKRAVYEMAVAYPDYLKYHRETKEELTDMEKHILSLFCQGMDSQKICETCNITYNTLKYHNKNIYRKLGVKSRQEAVKKAGENGL